MIAMRAIRNLRERWFIVMDDSAHMGYASAAISVDLLSLSLYGERTRAFTGDW